MSRHTVLLDGGFVIHKLQERLKRFPFPADIIELAAAINADPSLSGSSLLRNYFYHARPLGEAVTHPVNGNTINFATSHTYKNNTSLLDHLEWRKTLPFGTVTPSTMAGRLAAKR